jgi:FkbM family methyltransferase
MRFSGRKAKIIIILLALLVAGEVYLLFVRSDIGWRAKVIAQKTIGGIPELTWSQTFTVIIPPFLYGEDGAYRTGFITRVKVEEQGPCPVLWKTPIGEIWGRLEDEAALELLLAEQLIEREYDHELASVAPGDIVLDIGSHLGTFTQFALKKGARKVVGFEPEPVNNSCFKRTFAREIRSGTVALVEAAAWHSSDTLRFQRNAPATGRVKNQGWSNEWDSSAEEFEVQAVTIDDQVETLGLNQVDLIKMDIEGAERHALAGATETLKNSGPKMILCIYHRADDPVVIPEIVLGARSNYQMLKSGPQAYFYLPN